MKRRLGAVLLATLSVATILVAGAQNAHAELWICQPQPNPTITISDGQAVESAGSVRVKVTLNSCQSAKVDWASSDGTAVAGLDYTGGSGPMTLTPPHSDVLYLVFPVTNDRNCERNEQFLVTLSNAVGAGIADPFGIATIIDDDC